MARKANWFNPNDGFTVNRCKNVHTPGRSKNLQCQATNVKKALCKSRAHKNNKNYSNWDAIFSKV